MEIVIKIVQLLASLSLLVVVHEFGHFMFAKIFKCRVEKFYLFFDWKFSLFKKKIGDTEWGIGWIPFGGYVKIAGMIDESMDKEQMAQEPKPWEYRSKPAWQRLLIIIGGVTMNIVLAMVIYIGIAMAWGETYIKTSDVKDGFVYSQVAQDMGFRNGDKVISVDGEAVENFALIPQALLLAKQRDVVLERDGQQMTLNITDAQIKPMLKDRGFVALRFPFVIGAVVDTMQAAQAGLQAGDSVVMADSVQMGYFDMYTDYFAAHQGDTVMLSFVRGGEMMSLPVAVSEQGKIGVYLGGSGSIYPISRKEYNVIEAVPAGIERGADEVGKYLQQLRVIASPETQAYKEVGGFIAIGKIFPAQWSWFSFWQITALLSIMLAVINILPIPALDGGHLVFILYEMIARKAPSEKFMEAAQYVGFILVLALVVLANGNDLLKLFN